MRIFLICESGYKNTAQSFFNFKFTKIGRNKSIILVQILSTFAYSMKFFKTLK